eukprot:10845012-Alexandrium_andersonii.AAC.1
MAPTRDSQRGIGCGGREPALGAWRLRGGRAPDGGTTLPEHCIHVLGAGGPSPVGVPHTGDGIGALEPSASSRPVPARARGGGPPGGQRAREGGF